MSQFGIRLPWNQTNQVTKTETDWDSTPGLYNGPFTRQNPVEQRYYDFGSGSPGALLKRVHYNYLHLQNSTYLNANIADRPTDVTSYNGSGTLLAETTTTYDSSTLSNTNSGTCQSPAGAPNHDYCNFSATNLTRGNPTQINRWLNTTNTWLSTTNTYDDLGNLLTSMDPGQHTTTFSYADSWANSACVPSGVQTHGYVTQVTNALGQNTETQYYPCTGLAYYHRDQNDINFGRLGTTQTYDLTNRPLATTYPDNGQTTYNYNSDPVPPHVTKTVLASPDPSVVSDYFFDGLGRITKSQLTSDPEGADITDTSYDGMGRVYSVTNPYRTGAPSPTDGTTYYTYDALGRATVVTKQDGNTVQTSYSGNVTTVTDETLRQRQAISDALGRLTQVIEPNPTTGSLTSGSYLTYYSYDALGNLLSVNQVGDGTGPARTRSFTYDSLSRLQTAQNPETGTTPVTYSYVADATCNPGGEELRSKTDARGITTTYCYDGLHRLTAKTFSDSTPSVSFAYDMTSVWGVPMANAVGRLSEEEQGLAPKTAFSYDAMGRPISEILCTPSTCGNTSFFLTPQYDLAGHLTSLTYPSGRKITQGYNAAGQLTGVNFDSFNGTPVNYSYWAAIQRTNTWDGWAYYPHGAVAYSGSQAFDSVHYNNRLQPTFFMVWANGLTAYRTPNYYDNNGHDNGNLVSISDQLNPAKSQYFDYDSLNRIKSGYQGDNSFNQTFTPDAWGNLKQSGTAAFTPNFDGNNRISQTGYTYDAAGNLLSDTFHQYAYDAESRIDSVDSSVTYTYDADGNRVRKDVNGSDPTEYIYFNGEPIAEHDPTTGDWSDYIFANGKRVAKADNFENRVHVHGVTCSSCGVQYAAFEFPNAGGLNGYTIQSGDKLYVRQTQFGNMQAGVGLNFTDGSYSAGLPLYDSDSQQITSDGLGLNGSWHWRRIDLTPVVGKTVNLAYFYINPTGSGAWDAYYNDFVLASSDGSVHPLYTRESTVSLINDGSSGITGKTWEVNHAPGSGTFSFSEVYYHEDHLGTSRLITNDAGWPIWQGTFLPYGQEWNPQLTTNHYKFTGKERDSESNLDDFGARYYSSTMGRWLSPDWADKPEPVPYADLGDPQSLNLYGYVRNNPMNHVDEDGHLLQQLEQAEQSNEQEYCQSNNLTCDGPVNPLNSNAVGRVVSKLVDGDEVAQASYNMVSSETMQAKIESGTALGLIILLNTATLGEGKTVEKGTQELVAVYRIVENGKTVYVGITKDLIRRGMEHGIKLEDLAKGFTRGQARAVEQALIEHFNFERVGGSLRNKINSISPRTGFYNEMKEFGRTMAKDILDLLQ